MMAAGVPAKAQWRRRNSGGQWRKKAAAGESWRRQLEESLENEVKEKLSSNIRRRQ